MAYELIISCDTDASSGTYASKLDAMDAADEAAAVDGLTARYGNTTSSGYFVDSDGIAWFHFQIRETDQ